MIKGLCDGIYNLLWISQNVTTEPQQYSLDRSCVQSHVGDISLDVCLWFGLVYPLLGEAGCCDQSANAAPWESIPPSDPCRPLPSCHDAEAAAAQLTWLRECVAWGRPLAAGWLFFFFCTETGSPTHTDTLLLNRGHFSLAANTSSPPSCCPQSQSQVFP